MSSVQIFALGKRGAGSSYLVCDDEGVMLGPISLVAVSRDLNGQRRFQATSPDGLRDTLEAAYELDFDPNMDYRIPAIEAIARALNEGRITEATIGAVHLRLPELTPHGLARLEALAKYDPNQQRDWRGRWTSDGTGAKEPPAPSTYGQEARDRLPAAALDARTICIERCDHILERAKLYPADRTAYRDFQKCVNECMERVIG